MLICLSLPLTIHFADGTSYLLPPSAESVNLFQPLQHLIDNRTDFCKIYDTIQTPHTIRLICMRIFFAAANCNFLGAIIGFSPL